MLDDLLSKMSPCKPNPAPASLLGPAQALARPLDDPSSVRNSGSLLRSPGKHFVPAVLRSPCHVPASPEARSSASQSSCDPPSAQRLPYSPMLSPQRYNPCRSSQPSAPVQQHRQSPTLSPSTSAQRGLQIRSPMLSPARLGIRAGMQLLSPPRSRAKPQALPSPLRKATGPAPCQAPGTAVTQQTMVSPFQLAQSASVRIQADGDAAAKATSPVATSQHVAQALVQPQLPTDGVTPGQYEGLLLPSQASVPAAPQAPSALMPGTLLVEQTEPGSSPAACALPTALLASSAQQDVPATAQVFLADKMADNLQTVLPQLVAEFGTASEQIPHTRQQQHETICTGQLHSTRQTLTDHCSAQHLSAHADASTATDTAADAPAANASAANNVLPHEQPTTDCTALVAAVADQQSPSKSASAAASKQPRGKEPTSEPAASPSTATVAAAAGAQPSSTAKAGPAATSGQSEEAAIACSPSVTTRARAHMLAAGQSPAQPGTAGHSNTNEDVRQSSQAASVAAPAPASRKKTRAAAPPKFQADDSAVTPCRHTKATAAAAAVPRTRAATAQAQTLHGTPSSCETWPAAPPSAAAAPASPRCDSYNALE